MSAKAAERNRMVADGGGLHLALRMQMSSTHLRDSLVMHGVLRDISEDAIASLATYRSSL